MVVNRLRALIAAAFLVLVTGAQTLQACSVCFGDPNDPMTKAATGGVLFLAVVIYGVLFSFVGVTAFWVVRARRLSDTAQPPPESDEDTFPPSE